MTLCRLVVTDVSTQLIASIVRVVPNGIPEMSVTDYQQTTLHMTKRLVSSCSKVFL